MVDFPVSRKLHGFMLVHEEQLVVKLKKWGPLLQIHSNKKIKTPLTYSVYVYVWTYMYNK